MSNYSEEHKKELGKLVVQRMPRSRMRINPDFVPEFAAWLSLIGKRYERLREASLKLPNARDNKAAQKTAAVMEQWLACCQHLMDQLADKFSIHDWNEAWIAIDGAFGINNGPLAYPHYDGFDEIANVDTGD